MTTSDGVDSVRQVAADVRDGKATVDAAEERLRALTVASSLPPPPENIDQLWEAEMSDSWTRRTEANDPCQLYVPCLEYADFRRLYVALLSAPPEEG